ncbi:hypothetical protein NDA11_006700 [Ustilago hordei]|uniref:BTB domain-containing protein n=1 Tax=Ustilago hordei TaxID=120017 RepID=I2G2F2_USTHO|nr:uncharacterized protein UHO2_02495 [Ustilago hordei]KAJ1040166.1 hypothetical protein NDA10_001445 [Ustilago hordei]KAJ1585357.1 hypothetical protein NDA15_005503 [Ustilago hordei]KAJ1588373.1 hypothetical protein NDA12_006726 [Ustilago hordei]KAJ1593272.1 hypothetical protein NDA11_006700 [Ustilago hordei]KAJ1601534.1 hypothetical protein NDA14_003770 [Ustilago hordei]
MLHDCEGKTYWVAHDILYGGRAGPEGKYEDDLEATSPEAHYDRSAETGLYVSFRDGTLDVTLHVTEGSCGNIGNFKKRSRRLDVCISGYVGGALYSYSLSKENARFELTKHPLGGPDYYCCTWLFQKDGAEARCLELVDGCFFIKVTGYSLNSEVSYPLQELPKVSHPQQSLVSMATLLTSSDADFVLFAPTVPAEEKRTLRVHRRLLCEASTYFDTLFESDFAEASNLRRVQPHADKEQALKRQEEDRVEISGTMGSNTIPTINVDDISYKQLQTLVYYLYTGVAVFEKRRNLLVSSGKGESSTDASKPWWNGHLRPANAFDMYRLADKYGIEGLRIAALQYITSEISIEDLIKDAEMCEEISLFPEIAQVYKEFCECEWFYIKIRPDHKEIFKAFGVNPSDKPQLARRY